ncbi:unnamed protein product, partial [Allacma fusca]
MAVCRRGYYLHEESCHPIADDDYSHGNQDYDSDRQQSSGGNNSKEFHGKEGGMN